MTYTRPSIEQALNTIDLARPKVLEHLCNILNQYHHKNFSERYWEILCGSWLEHYLHILFSIWSRPSANKVNDLEIFLFNDTYEYLQQEIQNQFVSISLRAQIDAIVSGNLHSRCTINRYQSKFATRGIRSFGKSALSKISLTTPKVIISSPYLNCTNFEFLMALFEWRRWARFESFSDTMNATLLIDEKWRLSMVTSSQHVEKFVDIAMGLLPLNIPVIFIEGFDELRDKFYSYGYKRPDLVYTATGLHNREMFKLATAEWISQGTKLVCHQHGGCYGIDKIHALERLETRVSDRFYTWGWSDDHAKQKPLSPTIHPELKLPKHRNTVLVSCGNFPATLIRYQFGQTEGYIDNHISETISFLSEVFERAELLIRPYQFDYGRGFNEQIEAFFPGLQFDRTRPAIAQRYSMSKIVVHNYLATGWLETMRLNIPTICFHNANYEFRGSAIGLVNQLKSVGILHETGSEAGRFLNEVQKMPSIWWSSPRVQEIRNEFVDRYARSTRDWKREWHDEFHSLI